MEDIAQPAPPLWLQDESLRSLRERLAARPADIEVVSFDCFDTLLYRLCAEPSDLFVEAGRRLATNGLLKFPMTPEEYRSARAAADTRARRNARDQGRSAEVTLSAIYEELGNVVTDSAAAAKTEFEVERQFCYANPSLVSLLNHVRGLGLRTALVSDTYFTSAQIRQLLETNGISPALFDAMLISNEAGCSKWDGRLFLKACARLQIHPAQMLHLGDNLDADVKQAVRSGVEALHYPLDTARQEDTFKREAMLRESASQPAASLDSMRVLASRFSQSADDSFREGAFVFGPVMAGYADWCVRQFQAAGVRKVLALMREGEILGAMLEQSARAAGVPLDIQPCFVSRFSTSRAALGKITVEDIGTLFETCPTITPGNVMEVLGVRDEARMMLPPELLHKPICTALDMNPLLDRLLKQRRLAQLIEQRCRESRELAFEYLDGLTKGEEQIGVIDLGWSGNIQRNMMRILRLGGRRIRSLGCYVATSWRAGRLPLDGDLARAYLDSRWRHGTIPVEVPLTACIGSTVGYSKTADGRVAPVLGEYEPPETDRARKQRIWAGMRAFQSLWLEMRAAKPGALSDAMRADLDAQAASILIRFLDYPDPGEARRLGELTQDENFWGKRFTRPLCGPEAEECVKAHGAGRLFEEFHCHWPQGVIARANPRLVSTLSARWTNPLRLGRAGSTSNALGEILGLSEEERATFFELLGEFKTRQVLLCSRNVDGWETDFFRFWRLDAVPPGSGNQPPRLVSFGPAARSTSWHRRIEGTPADPAALRAFRACLQPGMRHTLALTGELDAPAVSALLRGVAPFLEVDDTIFIAQGVSDLPRSVSDQPVIQLVTDWLRNAGRDQRFFPWEMPIAYPEHACRNWRVLMRGQRVRLLDNFPQLTLADLPVPASP